MGGPLSSRPSLPGGPYLVAGLGRAGLAAAEALVRHTAAGQVSAWDESAAPRVTTRAAHLRELGVTCVIGTAREEKVPSAYCVVKSPGMSAAAPVLSALRAAGAEVIDELELGWRLGRSPMVGITGTDGKTGTAHLVAAAIDADRGGATVVAGNSELHPPLSAVDTAGGTVVCEASSYQLEGCSALVADVAVPPT